MPDLQQSAAPGTQEQVVDSSPGPQLFPEATGEVLPETQESQQQPSAPASEFLLNFSGAPASEWLFREKNISLDLLQFDSDLKFGQIRPLTATLLEAKYNSFRFNPPSAPISVVVWARDATCMFSCRASLCLCYSFAFLLNWLSMN